MLKTKKIILFSITICLLITMILMGLFKNNQTIKVIQSPKKNYTETRGITIPPIGILGGLTLLVNGVDVSHSYYNPSSSSFERGCSSNLNPCTLNLEIPVNGLVPGQSIPMVITALNTDPRTEGMFVRANVEKHWIDDNGNVLGEEDPFLIEIEYDNPSNWIEHINSSTPTRAILYYNRALAQEEESLPLTKSIKLNENVSNVSCNPTYENGVYHSNCTNTGKKILIHIAIDAIQARHCDEAAIDTFGLTPADIEELGFCVN